MEMNQEKTKRNVEIVLMRLDRKTYREIGDKFVISPNRARQIVYKHRRKLMKEWNRVLSND